LTSRGPKIGLNVWVGSSHKNPHSSKLVRQLNYLVGFRKR
jgi:hypothetical protein